MDVQMRINLVLSTIDRSSTALNNSLGKAQSKLSAFSKKSSEFADKSFKSGQQMIASGVAVAAPLYKAFQAASEFESKMTDIGKQLESSSPEEYAQKMANMSKQVMQLGREIPLATGELQGMIASSLRMGVAEDKVVDFTKEVAKMGKAFDMPAEEVAGNMATIAKIYDIDIKKDITGLRNLGDSINYLDDKTSATGPNIINVLQRIGGSAKVLGSNNAAALASTMLTLGETSETAGTALSAMLNKLSAAGMQGKKFQSAISEMGMNSADIQKRMADPAKAQGALMEVLKNIKSMDPSKQTEMLIKLFGNDHTPKLKKLVEGVGELETQLGYLKGAQKDSMNNEYQRQIQTSASKMQLFRNRVEELSVKVGNALIPVVTKIAEKLGVWMDKIGAFIDEHPELVGWIVKAAVAFSALSVVGGYLSFVIGGVAKFISIASSAIGGLVKAIRFVSTVISILSRVLMANPILLLIAAIAFGVYMIIKHWDKVKAFFIKVWEGVKAIFRGFVNTVKTIILNFTPAGLIYKHWDKIKAFFSKIWDGVKETFWNVIDWIAGLGTKFYEAGKNIINSIWEGIKSMVMAPINAVKDMVNSIRDFLPFSPAKTGPLKDIHRIKLVETIADGIKPAPMVQAMQKVTGASYEAMMGTANSLSTIGMGGVAAGGGTTVNFTINLNGGTKNDAALVAAECKKQFQLWMKDYNNQQSRVKFT